tara:strand:- start:1521 stop:1811 length:291 start_codon:yes stop_codon:yes gene_type:complete
MDDILNDLIIANGKERPAKKKAVNKTKKDLVKSAKQPVAVEPAMAKLQMEIPKQSKYSEAELITKDTTELKAICSGLGIPVPRRKTDLIKNILDNN